MAIEISVCRSERDAKRWQEFVDAHAESTNYHRWKWRQVIENSFNWPTFYLMAEEGGEVRGILPLAWQKSWLFGSFVSSLPFLSSGGIVAETKEAEQRLLEEAISLTKRLKADYLELRYLRDPGLNLPLKSHKVTLVRPVEPDPENMWEGLQNRVRRGIRSSMKNGLTVKVGQGELLDDFYGVFTENMRHFGTPVYSRNFFGQILSAFPAETHIGIVCHQGKAVAATFLCGFRDTVESKWTCSLRKYLPLRPNFYLTWNLLCFAGKHGYSRFDFGRSLVGSGSHHFKLQWGSEAIPLYWAYWLPKGKQLPDLNVENPRYQQAMKIWQKLPLAVTNSIGPRIVKYLPS